MRFVSFVRYAAGGSILGLFVVLLSRAANLEAAAHVSHQEMANLLGGGGCTSGCSTEGCPINDCAGPICEKDDNHATKCISATASTQRGMVSTGECEAEKGGGGPCGTQSVGDRVNGECPDGACTNEAGGCGGEKYICEEDCDPC